MFCRVVHLLPYLLAKPLSLASRRSESEDDLAKSLYLRFRYQRISKVPFLRSKYNRCRKFRRRRCNRLWMLNVRSLRTVSMFSSKWFNSNRRPSLVNISLLHSRSSRSSTRRYHIPRLGRGVMKATLMNIHIQVSFSAIRTYTLLRRPRLPSAGAM